MEKEITFTEQEVKFIQWHMDVVLDEDDWSATSKAIAINIIRKLKEK